MGYLGRKLYFGEKELGILPDVLKNDDSKIRAFMNEMERKENIRVQGMIKKVIFSDPATVVIWEDGTKTKVKCQPGDTYSKEMGLAMCVAKKHFGNRGNYNDVFKKFIEGYGQ